MLACSRHCFPYRDVGQRTRRLSLRESARKIAPHNPKRLTRSSHDIYAGYVKLLEDLNQNPKQCGYDEDTVDRTLGSVSGKLRAQEKGRHEASP